MTVKTLIAKAAKKAGSRYKLAKILEVTTSQVYDWESGRKTCSPADRARLAGFGGDKAAEELVTATLESTAGTTRGKQLENML